MKGRKIVTAILRILNLIAVLALILAYCAAWIDPRDAWPLAFFGMAYPLILIVNIVFVLIWLLLWNRFIWISLIVILAGWNNLRSTYPIGWGDNKQDSKTGIKVMSYNIHGFSGRVASKKENPARKEITEFLQAQKPDILFLQEYYTRGEDPLAQLNAFGENLGLPYNTFANYYGRTFKKRINAIVIFSKFPVKESGFLKLENESLFAVYADILIGKKTVRVYNLHLESIRFGKEDYTFYSHLTDPETNMQNAPLREGSKRMFWKLRRAFSIRSAQVAELKEHMKKSKNPLIIAGDFNDTPYSYTYRQVTKSLHDTYRESGSGFFESTYAGPLPSYRIDFITHSSHFSSSGYNRHDLQASDHYPVSATLYYNP